MSDEKYKGNGRKGNGKALPRVGVFVCHCGTNIAGTVDVAKVVAYAATLPGVVVAKEHKYMCSDPGQSMIQQDIEEHKLDRVVVSSCSPLMHESTFRGTVADAGLNQFLFQMANIREQCSWVHEDRQLATQKAMKLVRAAVARVIHHTPLEIKTVPVNPATLIVGGGIAGIEAALALGKAGHPVYLVEREASIGGKMAQFDKTFPTLDCSACILTPKMVSTAKNKNVTLFTFSEVEEVSGYVGNFKVKIRKKPRMVDVDACINCGSCWQNCPASIAPTSRRIKIGDRVIKERVGHMPVTPIAAGGGKDG
ncbi:MAG: FAD-dependent oxidoreductase [bacterium]|jgi:heterodisulfide reductase subunit A